MNSQKNAYCTVRYQLSRTLVHALVTAQSNQRDRHWIAESADL